VGAKPCPCRETVLSRDCALRVGELERATGFAECGAEPRHGAGAALLNRPVKGLCLVLEMLEAGARGKVASGHKTSFRVMPVVRVFGLKEGRCHCGDLRVD
jgi:hypothetical protein